MLPDDEDVVLIVSSGDATTTTATITVKSTTQYLPRFSLTDDEDIAISGSGSGGMFAHSILSLVRSIFLSSPISFLSLCYLQVCLPFFPNYESCVTFCVGDSSLFFSNLNPS